MSSVVSKRAALFALLCGALALGFSPIFVRWSDLDAIVSAFYRAFLAVPVLGLIVYAQHRRGVLTRLSWRHHRWLMLAGFFFAGDLAFWHSSVNLTSVANATLFATSTPIWMALFIVLVLRESIGRDFVIALFLCVLGAVILMHESISLNPQQFLGDVLGLMTALFLTAYILSVKRLRRDCSTSQLMFWTSLWTSMFLLPVAYVSGGTLYAQSTNGWLVLLGLALLTHIVGQGAFAYAMASLSARFTSMGMLLEVVTAAFCGWLLLAETLSLWQCLGGAVIVLGIWSARRSA